MPLQNIPNAPDVKPEGGVHPTIQQTYKDFKTILALDAGKVPPPEKKDDTAPKPADESSKTDPTQPPEPIFKSAKIPLSKMVAEGARQEKVAEEAAKAAAVKPAEPPKPADAAPAPKLEEKPVQVVKKEPLEARLQKTVAEAVRSAMPPPLPPIPAPITEKTPVTPVPDAIETGLGEDELDLLELARYGAKTNPVKYETLPARMLSFYKALDAYLEAGRKDDPDRRFDHADSAYQDWLVKNRPVFTNSEQRKLRTAQIAEQVGDATEKKMAPRIEQAERRVKIAEATPLVERGVAAFQSTTDKLFDATEASNPLREVVDRVRKNGWDKAVEEEPTITPQVQRVIDKNRGLAAEYLSIVNGIKPPDAQNASHQWLNRFIENQANAFKQNGGDMRRQAFQDGSVRDFLTPVEYQNVVGKNPASANLYWTLSQDHIVQALAGQAAAEAQQIVASESKKLEKSGFVKKQDAPAPAPKPKSEEPKPSTSPKTAPPPSPGTIQGTKPPTKQSQMAKSFLHSLGVPDEMLK